MSQALNADAKARLAQNLGSNVQQSQNAALNQWTGSVTPWPYYQPQYWVYPPTPTKETYANEVTVEFGEFDATLVFKRKAGPGNVGFSEIARVTIPRALGEAMAKQLGKKGR